MARPTQEEARLLERRNAFIEQLSKEGYGNAELARLFNVSRSVISRLLKSRKKQT